MEQQIINRYGALTPSRILAYFTDKGSFFQVEHEKRPYTFIVLGRGGPTGKTWLRDGLKKHGFAAFEVSGSALILNDNRNHVIKNDIDRSIVIILNHSLHTREEKNMQCNNDIYNEKWYRSIGDEERYSLDPGYQEIITLHDMLVANDIPHIIRRIFEGWQICYGGNGDPENDRVLSAIEHGGSYGNSYDKIEIMGLLTPEEGTEDDVVGWLTAEDVYGRIKNHWDNLNKGVVV